MKECIYWKRKCCSYDVGGYIVDNISSNYKAADYKAADYKAADRVLP
jgi:hypothetical protein